MCAILVISYRKNVIKLEKAQREKKRFIRIILGLGVFSYEERLRLFPSTVQEVER